MKTLNTFISEGKYKPKFDDLEKFHSSYYHYGAYNIERKSVMGRMQWVSKRGSSGGRLSKARPTGRQQHDTLLKAIEAIDKKRKT